MVPPRTARSVVPGAGRLGLVDPTANDDLAALRWRNLDAVPLLWSLSRAPDADLALRTLVRLRDELDAEEWAELDGALHTRQAAAGSAVRADRLLDRPGGPSVA